MKRAIIISVLLLIVINAAAQEITVTAAPDTNAIIIGDQLHFRVSAVFPEGVNADLPGVRDTLAGTIVILDSVRRRVEILPSGRTRITDDYLITSFDSGTYVIPPFYAEVKSGDSLKRYYSDYSYLRVRRPDIMLQDTTDVIFDIVPPRKAPVTFREILPWIIIALVMGVIIWLLSRYLPRVSLRKIIQPAKPSDPPHVIALRELNRLREEELWQKGEVKEYYSRLSDILRRYIDGRYGIMSPELTTDETVRMLQRASVLNQPEMSIIKEILSVSDMVKFAKYSPQTEVHENSFSQSVRFIEMTMKRDPETPENQEAKGGNHA